MPRDASPARAAGRRIGYVIGALANLAMLYLVNVWPGWESVPFLTDETPRVLVLLNLSLIVGVVANLAYVAFDAPWFVALGGVVTTAVGIIVLARIWVVFPFSFTGTDSLTSAMNWELIARLALIAALVGSVIGLVVQFLRFLTRVSGPRS
jgi:hypothetical protein